jgi:GTP-binding protein HflX
MEKIIIAALQTNDKTKEEINASLDELESLCLTDMAIVVCRVIQNRDRPDPAYFIGYGKALEIKNLIKDYGACAVVFDDQLKPIQQRNLEKTIGVKVIDRTRVILDIFAIRARTKEGKLQVQRAELSYHLSRLVHQEINLDSQTGGIGTRRGPGEKKLENDKRKIRDEIAALNKSIEKIKERRDIQRKLRAHSDLPEIAIVGYTNAGKSTLLKALSKSAVYCDDKLFATLDPLTRKIKLPNSREVLLTDTVGFINKLPHDLVAAFRATMEEILRARCILHVVDASSPCRQKQMETVLSVIKDIGAQNIPMLTVYNKSDKIDNFWKLALNTEGSYVISAKNLTGIDSLLLGVEKIIQPRHNMHKVKLQYCNQNLLCNLYNLSIVKAKKYKKENIEVFFECSDENWMKIKNVFTGQ